MSTPGGHAEGEVGAQIEGGFRAAGERDPEEEELFQQFAKQRAAQKAEEANFVISDCQW